MKENGPRPANPESHAPSAESDEAVAFLEGKFDQEQLERRRARLLREAVAREMPDGGDNLNPDELRSLMECAGFTDDELEEVMEIHEITGLSLASSISHLHWRRRFHQRMAELREEETGDPPERR
ncbi:hypothetical protein ACH4YO_23410 [Streptomyces noursei]|uniref:hypothetical protein n=1 Tax=Streptomyces noursei TaxID=1971 RepID=UPI0033E0AA08